MNVVGRHSFALLYNLGRQQPHDETRIGVLELAVRVNREACDHIADLLATKEIPLDQEESSLPGFPRQLIGNFFLVLVAICHQTSPRGRAPLEGTVAGIRRRGWDYLFARLEEAARRDSGLLTPDRWFHLSTDDVRQLFRDPELGDRLTFPELRAKLLRDLGAKMNSHDWNLADQIYRYCNGSIATGNPNLLKVLSEFRAYSDPVRKKSVFFLALMRNSGLWQYSDDEVLGPPVDYHEVRGHLRLGTVYIADPELLEKVHTGLTVTAEEDVAIRQAVYDAIMHISERSGLRNSSQLHYLFWNLFRSICTRDAPQCFALKPDCPLPDRYMQLVDDHCVRQCPFASLCHSAGNPNPICEHVFETDYY